MIMVICYKFNSYRKGTQASLKEGGDVVALTSEDLFDQVGESEASHHNLLLDGVLVLLNVRLRESLVLLNA